jgi:hypothetical protein
MELDFGYVLHVRECSPLPSENCGFAGPLVELKIKVRKARMIDMQRRKVKRGVEMGNGDIVRPPFILENSMAN